MANDAIDYINRDIVNVKKEIEILNKIVRDGNGQPSLTQQVATISNKLTTAETSARTEMQELRQCIEEFRSSSEERSNVSWQFKTAVLVALITGLTSIFINWQNTNANTNDIHVDQSAIIELNQKMDQLLRSPK